MAEHVTVKMSDWLKHVMLLFDFCTWQKLLLGFTPCVSPDSGQTQSDKLHNHKCEVTHPDALNRSHLKIFQDDLCDPLQHPGTATLHQPLQHCSLLLC